MKILAGGAIWLAAVIALRLNLIEALTLWAPFVIVPLGLRAIPLKSMELPAFIGALFAAASFIPAPGNLAGALAAPWALVTFAMAFIGAARLFRRGRQVGVETLIDAALMLIAVGGAGLVMSRAGMKPGGFDEPIVLLTAVHFHYTAFAAPVLAGLAGRYAGPRRSILLAGGLVVIATPMLAAGFTLHLPALKLAAITAIAAGLLILSMELVWIATSLPRAKSRILLGIAAFSIFWGMILAVLYGIGENLGPPLITIPAMALSHGVLNGFGFATCGLLSAQDWRP